MRRRAATLARACHAGARTPGGGRVLIGRGLVLLAGLLCALVAAAVAAGRGGTDALHAQDLLYAQAINSTRCEVNVQFADASGYHTSAGLPHIRGATLLRAATLLCAAALPWIPVLISVLYSRRRSTCEATRRPGAAASHADGDCSYTCSFAPLLIGAHRLLFSTTAASTEQPVVHHPRGRRSKRTRRSRVFKRGWHLRVTSSPHGRSSPRRTARGARV